MTTSFKEVVLLAAEYRARIKKLEAVILGNKQIYLKMIYCHQNNFSIRETIASAGLKNKKQYLAILEEMRQLEISPESVVSKVALKNKPLRDDFFGDAFKYIFGGINHGE